jgi:curved DNA-binding protein CbpA
MADETYYSLLEISETATAAEIRTAYRRLIGEVHPDRLANAPVYWQRQAEEKSKEINEAYTVLSNREKRDLYDSQLASYRGSGNGNGSHTSQSSAPSSPTSSQRQAQSASRSHSPSGASARPAQTPSSNSQQHQPASTSSTPTNAPSQPSSQPFVSKLTAGERFFAAFVGCVFAFGLAIGFWNSTSIGDNVFCFLLAGTLLFGVACLYQRQISRVLGAIGVKRPKHQLWATLGIILLVLFVGKIANMNWDTHFRGSDDRSATNAQISQVKIINGSLSDTTVSGNSNEKYPSAYNFTGYIQNDSTATVSFIRMKIRIFDCPETGSPSSHTSYGINYKSGIYDPSPPASCNTIGEEEEDDFPGAEPGQSVGFANFYFPNHPKGSLRWNYEIAAMDTRKVTASAPTPPNAEDVYYREQPWPGTSRDYIFPDGSIITTPAGYALINNDDGTPAQFNKDGFLYTNQSRVVVSVKEHVGAKVTSTGECVAWSGVCGIVKPIAKGEPKG